MRTSWSPSCFLSLFRDNFQIWSSPTLTRAKCPLHENFMKACQISCDQPFPSTATVMRPFAPAPPQSERMGPKRHQHRRTETEFVSLPFGKKEGADAADPDGKGSKPGKEKDGAGNAGGQKEEAPNWAQKKLKKLRKKSGGKS